MLYMSACVNTHNPSDNHRKLKLRPRLSAIIVSSHFLYLYAILKVASTSTFTIPVGAMSNWACLHRHPVYLAIYSQFVMLNA